MNNEIKDNLYDLYSSYHQHKQLFEYWQQNKSIRSKEEILERLEYLKKNPKINQRTELETFLWLLNEVE